MVLSPESEAIFLSHFQLAVVSPVNVLMSGRFTVWPMSTEEPAYRIILTEYLQSGHLHLCPCLCVTSREAQEPVSAKPQGKEPTSSYVVGCSGVACTVLSHQGPVLHSDLSCLQSHGNFRMVLDPGPALTHHSSLPASPCMERPWVSRDSFPPTFIICEAWAVGSMEVIAESEGELKTLVKVKEQSEKAGLKLNIQKTKIRKSSPITSWQIDREKIETVTDFIFLGSKITVDGDCSHKIKRHLLLGRK